MATTTLDLLAHAQPSARLPGALTLPGLLLLSAIGSLGQTTPPADPHAGMELVKPSQADPRITQHDEDNVVLLPDGQGKDAPLAIFLPGSNGRPQNVLPLLQTVAQQGYRVIGLSYDDSPSVSQVCPKQPEPACSARFREMRAFGRGSGPVSNPPAEAVDARLIALLQYLNREHPDAGWSAYLTPDNRPQWSQMLVSGLSQGAGMAAYIAKFYPVYRVVLFSSPWDVTGRDHHPAPWLSHASATPADRWWAERPAREKTPKLLEHAYQALEIPRDHILIFNRDLGFSPKAGAENPYHGSTVKNTDYRPEWRQLYGNAVSNSQ